MTSLLQTLKQLVSRGGIEGYFAVKYAEFARDTPAMRDEYRRLAARTAAAVQAGQVLEIGPGPGFIAIEIARLLPGVQVVGLDLSETMIDIATANAREQGVSEQVAFREGYTVQEAEQFVDNIPFASVRTEVDGISMAIWLEK